MTSQARPDPAGAGVRFVIIGAGMSGIVTAIKLQEAGLDDFAIYEKADRLGGTWRENTYPGIACDVPSHFYSYSFALNPEWSHRFAPGAEIQAYFEDVARRYGLDSRIQYGKEVTRCAFQAGRWHLEMADGSTDQDGPINDRISLVGTDTPVPEPAAATLLLLAAALIGLPRGLRP